MSLPVKTWAIRVSNADSRTMDTLYVRTSDPEKVKAFIEERWKASPVIRESALSRAWVADLDDGCRITAFTIHVEDLSG